MTWDRLRYWSAAAGIVLAVAVLLSFMVLNTDFWIGLLGLLLVVIIASAIIATVAIFSRTPTGRGTGGRGTYFASFWTRLSGVRGLAAAPRSEFLNMAIKLLAALVLVQFVLVQSGVGNWWMLLAYIPLMIVLALRETATTPGMKKALGVLAIIGFIGAGFSHLPWFKPCDEACQLKRQEAAQYQAKQKQEALEVYKQSMQPAHSADCPGTAPSRAVLITTSWHPLDHGCDATWVVTDSTGKILPPNVVETEPSFGTPEKIRMKEGAGHLFVMFCPPGTRLPPQYGWTCKAPGIVPVRRAGIDIGLGVSIGGYRQ